MIDTIDTIRMILAVVGIVVSSAAALPWTDRELRASARAFGILAALPWLVVWACRAPTLAFSLSRGRGTR